MKPKQKDLDVVERRLKWVKWACHNFFKCWCQCQSPIFFIEYLTQNVMFHVKSHVTKHEFWGLLILKSQHIMLPNLTWNETWNDTSLKKLGGCLRFVIVVFLYFPLLFNLLILITYSIIFLDSRLFCVYITCRVTLFVSGRILGSIFSDTYYDENKTINILSYQKSFYALKAQISRQMSLATYSFK